MNQRIASLLLFAPLLALPGAAAQAADVYRSVAADGTVSYSDRPQAAGAQFVFSANARAAAPAPAGPASNSTQSVPQAPANPTLPPGASADQLREQRAKNCATARERMDRYALSRRLFTENAAGEREYLDEAAVAAARAKAAADVEDWCD